MKCDEIYCTHFDNGECNDTTTGCKPKMDMFLRDIRKLRERLKSEIQAKNASESNAQEVIRVLDNIMNKYDLK